MKILISVNGNHKLGMGHIYRALNLSKELKKNKIDVFFLTRTIPAKKILSKNFKCFYVQDNEIKQQKILEQINPDVIIIDSLKEKTSTIKNFKKYTKKIIGIDYIGKNKHEIPIGINMLYPKSGISSNYSGPKFVILNQQFMNVSPITINKKVRSVLVLQGGSDTLCFTPKIINSLNHVNEQFSITVVLGPSFRCWNELKHVLKNNKKNIKILHNVNNMHSIMKKHDMAISGGGMTLLELSKLGIPTIVICGAEFENETARLMQSNGSCINLGFGKNLSESKISNNVKKLIDDYNRRKNMNFNGRKLIDGNGKKRILEIISDLVIC